MGHPARKVYPKDSIKKAVKREKDVRAKTLLSILYRNQKVYQLI
jgi:hypothetical protein